MEEKSISLSFEGLDLQISCFVKNNNTEWILCLHGIQTNKQIFKDFLKQPFLKNYSLLAVDLIGFGDSSKPEDFSYDIVDQAKILEQLLNILDIQKLHIIGHSLGGTVGTMMLEPLKEKIVSFINLEGNLTLADSSVTKEVAAYSYEEFKKEKYNQIKEKVKNSNENSASFRSKCLEIIPDYAFYKTSISIINWATDDKLLHLFSDATCQKLYIYGDKVAFKKDIAPESAEKVEIPNAGHFMILDNPTVTYRAIENFLLK